MPAQAMTAEEEQYYLRTYGYVPVFPEAPTTAPNAPTGGYTGYNWSESDNPFYGMIPGTADPGVGPSTWIAYGGDQSKNPRLDPVTNLPTSSLPPGGIPAAGPAVNAPPGGITPAFLPETAPDPYTNGTDAWGNPIRHGDPAVIQAQKPADPSKVTDPNNPFIRNQAEGRPRTWQELTPAERTYFRSQYLRNSADAALDQQAADADAAWRYGMMSMQPYTYSSGVHIPAGGGSATSGLGNNQITGLPGFSDTGAAATGTTPATGGTAAPATPAAQDTPPTLTPTALPASPTYGSGQTGGNTLPGAGSVPGANSGASGTVPEWLQPYVGNTMSPQIADLIRNLGVSPVTLPPYPTTGQQPGTTPTTGGAPSGTGQTGGPVTVPGVNLPQAPNMPTPILNLPGVPNFNPTPLPAYDPNAITSLYNQLTGQGQGTGSGGANGTASGGLFPGQAGNAGGNAPGSTGNAFMDSLMRDYQQQQDAARQANETRYNDILGGYTTRHANAIDMLANLGLTEQNVLDEQYARLRGQTEQDMINRGLSNTTVQPQMLRGIEKDKTRAYGELKQRVNQTALGLDTQLSGDTLGFMERRTDQGPDSAFLAQLMQGLGEAGYAGGSSGTTGTGTSPTTPQGSGTGTAAPALGTGPSPAGAGSSAQQPGFDYYQALQQQLQSAPTGATAQGQSGWTTQPSNSSGIPNSSSNLTANTGSNNPSIQGFYGMQQQPSSLNTSSFAPEQSQLAAPSSTPFNPTLPDASNDVASRGTQGSLLDNPLYNRALDGGNYTMGASNAMPSAAAGMPYFDAQGRSQTPDMFAPAQWDAYNLQQQQRQRQMYPPLQQPQY